MRDRPQVLALRVEHDECSPTRLRFVRCHGDHVDVALAVHANALGMRLTRRQRGEALDLAALPGLRGDRRRQQHSQQYQKCS